MAARWPMVVLVGLACVSPRARPPAEPADTTALSVEDWLEQLRAPAFTIDSARVKSRVGVVSASAKGDIRDVYRKVAPSTVLIKTRYGFGTGSIIDARGFILTNHHVIADGEQVDFKTRVQVELGTLGEGGIMELRPGSLTAWVLKSDPLADLAVIKLDAPPSDLVALKVAGADPVPGEPVSAIGNGGIGLLWAIKDGEISSIGRLATHLAHLVGAECDVSADPLVTSACKSSRSSLEAERKQVADQVPGLVIQTSCTISPGDSGGALVNRAGELVGVNAFLRSDPHAPVTSNFHVHVAEVRKFLAEVPSEPRLKLPDPWELAKGGSALLRDNDGDGFADALEVFAVNGAQVVFFDLDQRSQLRPYDSAAGVLKARSFPSMLAATQQGGTQTTWADRNGDGRFERLAIDREGKGATVWAIDSAGHPQPGPAGQLLIDRSGLTDPQLARLDAALVRYTRLGLKAESPALDHLPDPLLAGGISGRLVDTDRDGKLDAALTTGSGGLALLLDPANTEFATLTNATLPEALKARSVSPRASLVQLSGQLWAFLDTDTTRGFDLVLASTDTRSGAATRAWTLNSDGTLGDERPELMGSMVSRPDSIGATAAERTRVVEQMRVMAPAWAASGRGQAGLPHPIFDVGTDIVVEPVEVPGFENAVISVVGKSTASLVFELDRSSLKGQGPTQMVARARQGMPGADFAWVKRGDLEWFFYDSSHSGAFDVVLFCPTRAAVHGLRRTALGTFTWDSALDDGPVLRPSLFKDAARQEALSKLAGTFFTQASIGK